MKLEQRLHELNIELPMSAAAGGAYAPVVVHGDTIYVSGQLPRDGDKVHVVGQVGRDVTLEDAKRGARLALIHGLAAIKAHLGSLDNVAQILKLTVFVHSAADFSGQTAVADGASELIMELFGPERGLHPRTSVGVAQLAAQRSDRGRVDRCVGALERFRARWTPVRVKKTRQYNRLEFRF
ncbi:RidA family protein [Bradyrhizobium sp. 26S5]|uniref:RidA family protein n=1 Tax=Bradyrhizobium sp. 26S5 TaxID=3139729 RepID=UPI0030CA63E7